ncbi:hypothetical protein VCHE16_3731, partial [Vibrio paracholerae HE-16]
AHWDWKRRALTVPLEAFVSYLINELFVSYITTILSEYDFNSDK